MRILMLLLVLISSTARAALVLDATDVGEYTPSGQHSVTSTTARVGQASHILYDERAFFYFNTRSIDPTLRVTSASLRMELYSYLGDVDETFFLHQVTTPWDEVNKLNGGAAGIAIYNDLGDGPSYGQATVSEADEGSVFDVVLNSQAITDLNDSIVGNNEFIIGFRLDTLTGADLLTFDSSAASGVTHSLVLDTSAAAVPEPSCLAMLGIGALGTAVVARRRWRQAV